MLLCKMLDILKNISFLKVRLYCHDKQIGANIAFSIGLSANANL
jgi:hypothetical protein